jgi:hypothetical protein
MRGGSIAGVIVLIWLFFGVLASGQRGYFSGEANCAKAGTIAVTVIAGPLNYINVNPKVECEVPQPVE